MLSIYSKKITKYFLSFLVVCCFSLDGNAQTQTPWASTWGGERGNFTFEEIQESFKAYWENRSYEKGKGYNQYKRWEKYMIPRIYPSNDMTLPSNTYHNFIAWERTQNAGSRTGSGNWMPLGPFTKATGDDTGVGRLNMLRFHPQDSTIMYVGAPDGGLWKSTNSGASWSTNTDFLGVIGVADLAIDTINNVMYLATGDVEGDRRSIGVLKSTDGGTTWNTTGLTWVAAGDYKITKLLMHPTNPLILLAATNDGVYRTVDGGVSWNSSTPYHDFKDMEFKPGDPNTVYASGTELYKSTDNGVTWTQVTAGFPTTNVKRIALGVTKDDGNYVYAVIGRDDNNGFLGLYRSTNSGTSFTLQSSTPNLLGYVADGSDAAGQSNYDLAIVISPLDKNIVTVGGVNQWQSTDGGVNWNIISHWDPTSGIAFVHADVHELTYSPSGKVIYSCHDGGLGKSENGGATWIDVSNNLAISQQNSIAISATTESRYVAGLQDIGTISHSTATSWKVVGGGDGEDAFIDRTDDNYIVMTGTNGDHELSINGGTSFSSIVSDPLKKGDAHANFYSPIRQDPVTATRYYAGGRNHLYVSHDEGSTWLEKAAPFGTTGESNRITEFHIAPNTPAIIYAIKGTAIAKTVDSGTNWTNITGTLPVGIAHLSNLTVSNTDPNKVWVTFSGYDVAAETHKVYKTTDGGLTWTNISTGLPNLPVNTIVFHNGSANDDVYIGMDIGVYHINDNLSSWQSFFTDLPRVNVKNLRIFYPTGKLRAATYGRGTWESSLFAPLPVELTSFTGENEGNENLLYWTTATEINLDYYVIERSTNGHNFETIGTVEVENPNSIITKNYTFTDTKPAKGINYYRLKVVDTDRSFEYSKTVTLYLNDVESPVSIYPNPSVHFIEIKGLTENTRIRFIDVSGRIIRSEEVSPTTKVDVSAFPNGTYFIEIMTSDKTSTIQRFIKQ